MTKTTTIIAMIAGLTLGTGSTASAQTPQTETPYFVSVSAGGHFQSREFSPVHTFTLFDELGTVAANQTLGSGFLFDVHGGYRFRPNLAGAVGIATFRGNGNAAAIAAVPDSIFVGRPIIKSFDASAFGDLTQSNVAVNFMLVYTRPLTEDMNISIFGGPSMIRVSQELASVTEDPSAQPTTATETKTTGKAGSIGVDISHRLNPRYSAGAFVRYLGGSVDLPAIDGLKVGGVQVAGGIRVDF